MEFCPLDLANARQSTTAPEPQTVKREFPALLALGIDLGGVEQYLKFVQHGVPGFTVFALRQIRMYVFADNPWQRCCQNARRSRRLEIPPTRAQMDRIGAQPPAVVDHPEIQCTRDRRDRKISVIRGDYPKK